jgi:predicted HicB family RNase H-like nuclease
LRLSRQLTIVLRNCDTAHMVKKQTPIKVSVFLPPPLHMQTKLAAIRADMSLSAYIAAMVEKNAPSNKRRERETVNA